MRVASTAAMPFCDIAFARRIERAEQDLLGAATTNVRQRRPDVFGGEVDLPAVVTPSSRG